MLHAVRRPPADVAPAPQPAVVIIYDRVAMEAALPSYANDEGPDDMVATSLPVEEAARARVISAILDDPRGNRRPRIHASHDAAARLRAATATLPNFETITGIIERALIQSARTGRGLHFPPILATSPPGLGKSLYAHTVAAALDTTCVNISIPHTSDRGGLGGLAPLWRGAGIGRLAHGLIVASQSASPLFLIDEIDKPVVLNDDPSQILINALEPINARVFRDEYIQVACDLSASLFLASANDPSQLSAPLADRFVAIEIPAPDRTQVRRIVEAIALQPITDAGLIGLDDEAVEALADLPPRRIRLAIQIGCGYAVSASRGILTGQDVAAALDLTQQGRRRRQVGFLG